jgi:hypothetical protein
MRTEFLKTFIHVIGFSRFSEKSYKILLQKPEGKRPLKISRHRWEDNITVDQKLRCEGVDN